MLLRNNSNMVIGRFHGRMEYGPRALGNRSILSSAQGISINKWLNHRLKRTEFMPFASLTLDHMAGQMYTSMHKMDYTSEFITITTDCTEDMKKLSPAAVHADGTARPQIIGKHINPSLYNILSHYFDLTHIPNIINTSFNIHEEPIVCTPFDALKTFDDGRLDYLAIGEYLVVSPTLDLSHRPAV